MKFELMVFAFVTFAWSLPSCIDDGNRIIEIEDIRAEGKISKDTVYNGLIKFYSKATNKLLYENNYVNGILNGRKNNYFSNGYISVEQYYVNDKINGWSIFFDSTGLIEAKQYYYHGLKVGPSVQYISGNAKAYYFYSFDNDLLFELNYDSLNMKKIIDCNNGYFFYHVKEYFSINNGVEEKNREYFLYTPNPPLYKFNYSIVNVDSSNRILSTVEVLNSDGAFTTFSLIHSDTLRAVKLLIEDTINKYDYTLLKVLK